jgi:hypothetical protein
MTTHAPLERLCFALHRVTRNVVRCTMHIGDGETCGRVATQYTRGGDFACDICAIFIPNDLDRFFFELPYAEGIRQSELVMARGSSQLIDLDGAMPEMVGAATCLLASLPAHHLSSSDKPHDPTVCPRCLYVENPHVVSELEQRLRETIGTTSAGGSA